METCKTPSFTVAAVPPFRDKKFRHEFCYLLVSSEICSYLKSWDSSWKINRKSWIQDDNEYVSDSFWYPTAIWRWRIRTSADDNLASDLLPEIGCWPHPIFLLFCTPFVGTDWVRHTFQRTYVVYVILRKLTFKTHHTARLALVFWSFPLPTRPKVTLATHSRKPYANFAMEIACMKVYIRRLIRFYCGW